MTEVNITPELRFPDFKNGIHTQDYLFKFCEVNPTNGELPEKFIYIDLESVNAGRLEKENEINKDQAPSRAQRILAFGDILYQTVRPYQRNNYHFKLEGDYVASTGYAQIRNPDCPEYYYQLFHTDKFVNKVLRRCTGTSYPAINSTDLEKIPIIVPQNEEQQKIASFLTAVDDRIQLLQKKKAQLEEYKKGVMQKLFSQEFRFNDENGNAFPDWEEKRLGEIGMTFNGLTGKTKVDFGEGMPYVQYMQIFSNSKINVQEFGLVKIEENENQSKVQYGDVFFTTSSETPNEIGTASVMLEEVGDVYLNSFCFGFRPNSLTELVPQFSRYLFRSELFRREIIKLAQGSTRFNMSKVELMKLRVLLPKEGEQNKIANFLTSLDDSIESIGVEIDGSIEYKKGLLQKMFV